MSEPAAESSTTPLSGPEGTGWSAGSDGTTTTLAGLLWYRLVQYSLGIFLAAAGGWRATGRQHMPRHGAALLVSNHLSFLDVFLIGVPLQRRLNFMARSTLFVPVLGFLIRSVGGFPIQREGMGASGLKETLRRLRKGGIVTLFPEGTRSPDGKLAPLKPGIATLIARTGVPVVPAGICGTYEAWPRSRLLPRPYPLRIHFGPPIQPQDLVGMAPEAVTALIRERLEECIRHAREGLCHDLGA